MVAHVPGLRQTVPDRTTSCESPKVPVGVWTGVALGARGTRQHVRLGSCPVQVSGKVRFGPMTTTPPPDPTMVLDHVGIVVPSIEAAVERWQLVFGYRPRTSVVTNTRQKVRVLFLSREGSLEVKLIEPTDNSSPIHAMARRGGGLHHLCFRVASLDTEMVRLRALGLRIITEPQPGEAFKDNVIAFVYAGDGLNVELVDTTERASLLTD